MTRGPNHLTHLSLIELAGDRTKERRVARFDRIRLAGDLTLAAALHDESRTVKAHDFSQTDTAP